jgi:hypothetical protein
MGPFIDSEHPEVKKGAVDRSFDELFCQEILRRVTNQNVVNCFMEATSLFYNHLAVYSFSCKTMWNMLALMCV